MTRKRTHLVDITTKMREILTRTFVRNKNRIALGMVVAAAAVTGGLATAGSNAIAQRAPRHRGQPTNVAANKNVVRAFLKDVLAEHHGRSRGWLLHPRRLVPRESLVGVGRLVTPKGSQATATTAPAVRGRGRSRVLMALQPTGRITWIR